MSITFHLAINTKIPGNWGIVMSFELLVHGFRSVKLQNIRTLNPQLPPTLNPDIYAHLQKLLYGKC